MALLLYFFLRSSNPRRVLEVVKEMNPAWFVAALATNFAALFLRAARWRIILRPDDPPALYPTFFATAIGFMSSAILPIRAGDVVRPALLSRRTDIRFSTALGTVLTERVLDLLSILGLFVTFVLTSGRSMLADPALGRKATAVRTAAVVGGTIFLLMTLFVILLYFFHPKVRVLHTWLGRAVPERFRSGWMSFFDSFVASLSIVHNGSALARVLLFTAMIWLCLTGQFYLLMLAVGHPLPFSAGFFVTGITILGLSIPTPGGVGGFHKACQIALTNFYHFDVDTSVVVAIAFHIVGTLPVVVAGLWLLAREGIGLKQLTQIGEKVEE